MADLIDRQMAIDALDKRFDSIPMEQTTEILMLRRDLRELPPAEHTAHWIDIDAETYTWKVRCDKCGNERSMMSTQGRYPKFCEECGAHMIEKVNKCD